MYTRIGDSPIGQRRPPPIDPPLTTQPPQPIDTLLALSNCGLRLSVKKYQNSINLYKTHPLSFDPAHVLQRLPLQSTPEMRPHVGQTDRVKHDYQLVKVLDAGDGKGPGALNGGVFIVKHRKTRTPCILKQIRRGDVPYHYLEVFYQRHFDHPNLCRYIDGYVQRGNPRLGTPDAAGVYMELCDMGSLEDLINRYKQRPTRAYIEESFVWHVFYSLIKAIAYIHEGIAPTDLTSTPKPNWVRMLHRDIKPGNVFLKQRPDGDSITLPVSRYPTVVLGDFGLVIDQRDPMWTVRAPCGTPAWQPPEVPEHDVRGRGDVWSVGAVVQDMCRLDGGPMREELKPARVKLEDWWMCGGARRPLSAGPGYTGQLGRVMRRAMAMRKSDRFTAREMLGEIREGFSRSGVKFHRLPAWAWGQPLDVGT